jgi:hypothetical protein
MSRFPELVEFLKTRASRSTPEYLLSFKDILDRIDTFA